MGLFKWNKSTDITVGYNINRKKGKPIVLSQEDRFNNMLIIGSRGCGKISRALKPMIWQDMKSSKPLGITLFESYDNLSEELYHMALAMNRKVQYFNPTSENCAYFNPLSGREDDVVVSVSKAFDSIMRDSSPFIKNSSSSILSRGIKVVKALYGDNATLNDLYILLSNEGDKGLNEYILPYRKLQKFADGTPVDCGKEKERDMIANWFLMDYFNPQTKTFTITHELRIYLGHICKDTKLGKLLCPPREGQPEYSEYLEYKSNCEKRGIAPIINFKQAFLEGQVLIFNICEDKLFDLSYLLGQLISHILDDNLNHRPGNEDTRIPNMCYINDLSNFINEDLMTTINHSRTNHTKKVAFTLGIESMQAIERIFDTGVENGFMAMLNATGHKIIYSQFSYNAQNYYSKYIKGIADYIETELPVKDEKLFVELLSTLPMEHAMFMSRPIHKPNKLILIETEIFED